ncbi:unnamed protein product [Adineta steineri]|uniref:Uncharacterized protein n=1 Tax=Adineta steineri TaxID=433720 RepID=A0A814YQ23_9BILA|nr:unnamed protein product [Adineta steineri]CAF1567512.1 unnamed protein product [Adineta steineri]
MGHHYTKEQFNIDLDIDTIQYYVNEYKKLQPQSMFGKRFSPLLLLPYQTMCSSCGTQLKTIFQSCANIIYCTKIQPCLLYKADCHQCQRSHRLSSIYLMDQKSTMVNTKSQCSEFVHFSGALVFSKKILILFSCLLIDDYATFGGFGSAITKVLNKLRRLDMNDFSPEALSRNLQSVWLYYELANFIFMTNKFSETIFPYAMCEGRTKIRGEQSTRAISIERNLDWFYHLFTVFWSHHKEIFGECQCSGGCSRTITIDGHQKP